MEIGILTMSGKHTHFRIEGKNNQGFTIVEMMIAMVVASIVAICTFSAYSVQSKSYSKQREVAKIQQDIRGALYLMEFDLLNAGRDPDLTNRFGLTNPNGIRYFDYRTGNLDNDLGPTPFVMPAAPSAIYFDSFQVLEFSSLRRDTSIPPDGIGDAAMTIRYQVYDFNNDGRLDLGRRVDGANPDLVAEGVIAVAYAFAYNLNPNGDYRVSRTPPKAAGDPLGTVIWAADTDGDNRLDTNIDVDGDGLITVQDDMSGDGVIDVNDGADAQLANPVDIENAVAVRIWLLLQSQRESDTIDRNQYVVGNRIIPPPVANPNGFEDRFVRRVQTVTVALRNYRKF
jgi:type IV pilus assembly protein PilW